MLSCCLCVEWFFYKLSAIKHARCWWAWKYVLNVASLLRIEQEGYSGIVSIEELSDSVHHKQVLSFRSFAQFRGSCTSCHSIWLLQALPTDGRGWGLAGKLSALSFSLFLFLSFPISHLYWVLLWKLCFGGAKMTPSHWADCYFHAVGAVWRQTDLPRLPQGWNFSGTLSQGSDSLVSVSACCWVTCASAVLYQRSLMVMMMVTQGGLGVPAGPLRCPIDQRCLRFDCQSKDDRLCVKMPTFYRRETDEPLCEGMEDHGSLCLNKTQPAHETQSVLGLFHRYLLRSHDLTCKASLDLRRRSIITQSAQQLGKTACFHGNMATRLELWAEWERGATETSGTGVC